MTCLWSLDLASGTEHLVADPRALNVAGEGDLPAEERARRERAREQAGGIVGYATDRDCRIAAFTLGGRLYVADLQGANGAAKPRGTNEATTGNAGPARVRSLPATTPVFDPRPDPTGRRVAYVSGRTIRVIELEGARAGDQAEPAGSGHDARDRALVTPESAQVSYGLAEFIAAEEMGRMRGYWWAPDGGSLLVARVDETPVQRWHIGDPANPATEPTEIAYPAAGTPNAYVSLALLGVDGGRTAVVWDRDEYPYLVTADWDRRGPVIVLQSRDQRKLRSLAVDPSNGETALVGEEHDPIWLEVVPGVPARTAAGALVQAADDRETDTRRLVIDGTPVTPPGLQVRSVADVDGETVFFTASEEPTEIHVWSYGPDRRDGRAGRTRLQRLTEGAGVFGVRAAAGVTVVSGTLLDTHGTTVRVTGPAGTAAIASLAETPVVTPRVELLRAGDREIRTAVLLPTGWEPGAGALPVLMDPYGGPHAQRVLAVRRMYCEAQWLADQGFAVVIADGRGTPGRGYAWERSVHGDFAGPVLDDQVTALEEAARKFPGALDLGRVGIRGWSFGGWLAALAVLRRPDVFHAAVAGAPVTDWALYDTHYTERYLGHPGEEPESYARNSLLEEAGKLDRPLLLIHGLADDNVVAAHTLRLSSALLAAGRPHTVLPLSGVTHMTPQEVVAENLLHLQVDFLRKSLLSG